MSSWLVLLLVAPASSEGGKTITVTLFTDPSGAQIIDPYGDYLGITGEPVPLDTSKYGSSITFIVKKEGYETLEYSVPRQRLNQGRIPETGALVLRSKSVLVSLREFVTTHRTASWSVMVGAVLGLGLAGSNLRRAKSTLERARLERELKVTQDTSLVNVNLGGYRLVEVLGRGGMATVYRALPEATLNPQEAVAMKVLHRDALAQDWQRFRREVIIAKELNHPGIVTLLDYGSIDDKRYLVMELIEGNTLRDVLPLPLEHARRILRELGEAIAYAHSKGVVHRDLKPENVMLTSAGRVKVMDFGLAKTDTSSHLTATGTVMGTPSYMPPEQIQGKEVTPRMDQYAYGIMAYELLTGRLPFDAEDGVQMIYAHLSEIPILPSRHGLDLPEALDGVLLKMLAKDPQWRYESIVAASAALEEAFA